METSVWWRVGVKCGEVREWWGFGDECVVLEGFYQKNVLILLTYKNHSYTLRVGVRVGLASS